MCDVIKIRLNRKDESGKGNPKKEIDFYDVTRDILGFLVTIILIKASKEDTTRILKDWLVPLSIKDLKVLIFFMQF